MFLRDNGDMTSLAQFVVATLVMVAVFLIGALGGAIEASHLYYSHGGCNGKAP